MSFNPFTASVQSKNSHLYIISSKVTNIILTRCGWDSGYESFWGKIPLICGLVNLLENKLSAPKNTIVGWPTIILIDITFQRRQWKEEKESLVLNNVKSNWVNTIRFQYLRVIFCGLQFCPQRLRSTPKLPYFQFPWCGK